jgi:lipopolysaccharide export system protein LptA
MNSRCSTLFLACVLALVSPWVAAENADKSKPMNIEADSLRYDDARQLSVFTGRVVITKGTIIIRGHQVEVRQDAQGNQFGVVTASSTEPAFFRQKREAVDEFIEGDAQSIEYDSKADTVRFVQKAQLRRYRGTALADQISGGVIVYDNTKDLFTVDGATKQGASGTMGGRVRAMLSPKPEGTPAPAPAANLRPTTTLQGPVQ